MFTNIFFIFLKRVSTDTLIRFMSGNANILDYFKIVFSMPKKIFLKNLYFKKKKCKIEIFTDSFLYLLLSLGVIFFNLFFF